MTLTSLPSDTDSIEMTASDRSDSGLREAFACFPSGVAAVCAVTPNGPVGLAASSFTSVSMDPPLVSVCIQKTSTTWPVLRDRPALGVSILAEGEDATVLSLASKNGDRFERVSWHDTASGSVLVDGSTAWLDCTIHSELDAGDHVIALLEIRSLRFDAGAEPLVFHGSTFRKLARLEGV